MKLRYATKVSFPADEAPEATTTDLVGDVITAERSSAAAAAAAGDGTDKKTDGVDGVDGEMKDEQVKSADDALTMELASNRSLEGLKV